jgi:exodeoxyribonuclease VII small subunit
MEGMTFEKALKQLEQIVQLLETEDLPLETSLQKFEEGIQLSKFCSQKLDETEKKITILLADKRDNAKRRVTEKPFTLGNHSNKD